MGHSPRKRSACFYLEEVWVDRKLKTRELRNRLEGASLLYEQAVAKALPQRKDVNEYAKTRAKTRRDAARAMRLALLDQLA